jgi:hypothetical protein
MTTRFEIPPAYASWREGDTAVFVRIGAHCIDLAWPWFQPWDVRALRSSAWQTMTMKQTRARRRKTTPKRRNVQRRLDALDLKLRKLVRLFPLCGAGPADPCDRPKGHEGPHLWEWAKTVASLRDQIADLKTPSAREQLIIAAARPRCLSIGPKPQYYRCGLFANHHGNHSKVIPADAPWFPGPCTCPPDDNLQEPTCIQHGMQRQADRD